MNDIEQLQDRIDDLESKLWRYHRDLETAIQQRDRLALDAAWGIVESLQTNLGFFLPCILVYAEGFRAWWQMGLAAVVGFGFGIYLHSRANAERMKEVDRLAVITEWDDIP